MRSRREVNPAHKLIQLHLTIHASDAHNPQPVVFHIRRIRQQIRHIKRDRRVFKYRRRLQRHHRRIIHRFNHQGGRRRRLMAALILHRIAECLGPREIRSRHKTHPTTGR